MGTQYLSMYVVRMGNAGQEQRAAPSLYEVRTFWDLWQLLLFTFPFVHLSLSLILTLCPSHLFVLALSSSHLAKVISCSIERDWHCEEYTKTVQGERIQTAVLSWIHILYLWKNSNRIGDEAKTFGTQGRKEETNKKTMVDLAESILATLVWMRISAILLSPKSITTFTILLCIYKIITLLC